MFICPVPRSSDDSRKRSPGYPLNGGVTGGGRRVSLPQPNRIAVVNWSCAAP